MKKKYVSFNKFQNKNEVYYHDNKEEWQKKINELNIQKKSIILSHLIVNETGEIISSYKNKFF